MRTPRESYSKTPIVYTCELDTCPRCGGPLVEWSYVSGPKTVQTLATVLAIAHRPKRCADPQCTGYTATWKSVQWQQIAPRYCTYGYDVIAQIGWRRQRSVRQDYTGLRQTADWLLHIADLFDPEGKPARSGAAVRQELFAYLTEIQ